MQYRKLGRTDLEVSVICQGCWSIVTRDMTWGGNPLDESIATLRASVDAGVNFFDTAEMYGGGESEEIIAKALEGMRQDVILASKVSPGHLRPADLKASCERSLGHLKTDYIDLYQIHWPNGEVPVAETLGAMNELKQEGKIRHIGVSNFGVSFLNELLRVGRVESNQFCYSMLWRPVEHEVRQLCVDNDIGILCYSPLCQGLLAGRFHSADEVPEGRARTRLFSRDRPLTRHDDNGCEAEAFRAVAEIRRIALSCSQPMGRMALAWLLTRPGVTSVIAGARNPDQAVDNAGAADVDLSDDVLESLTAATDEVKGIIGTNCDPWQTESRMER